MKRQHRRQFREMARELRKQTLLDHRLQCHVFAGSVSERGTGPAREWLPVGERNDLRRVPLMGARSAFWIFRRGERDELHGSRRGLI